MDPSDLLEPDELLALDQQLCFALYTASRLMTRAYRPLLADIGLTYPQYLVMLALWDTRMRDGDPPTVGEIGERLHLDSGTLTPLLRRLEAMGHVERRRSTEDERRLHIHLTRRGQTLRTRAAEVPRQMLCDSSLPAGELIALRVQLQSLIAALEPDRT